MALATEKNPVTNACGNKIEFADGTCYAMRMPGHDWHRVKVFTL